MFRSPWSPRPTLSGNPPPSLPNNLQPCQHAALLTGSSSEAQRKQTGSDCENSAVGPSWCPPLISHKARFVRRADSSLALNRPTRWRLPGPSSPRPSAPAGLHRSLSLPSHTPLSLRRERRVYFERGASGNWSTGLRAEAVPSQWGTLGLPSRYFWKIRAKYIFLRFWKKIEGICQLCRLKWSWMRKTGNRPR